MNPRITSGIGKVDEANAGHSGQAFQDGDRRFGTTPARVAVCAAGLPVVFGVVVFLSPKYTVIELDSWVQWIIFGLVTVSSALLLAWTRRRTAYAFVALWFAEQASVVVLFFSLWRPLLACGLGAVAVLASLLMQAPRAEHSDRSYPLALLAGTLTVFLCVCVAVGHLWFGSLSAPWG